MNTSSPSTHIVAQSVQRTIVAPRLLLDAAEEVVLGDEVRRARVETACKEAGLEEVDQRGPAARLDEHVVESELGAHVEEVPARERLRADKTRAEGVEEDLECPAGKPVVRGRDARGRGGRLCRDLREEDLAEHVVQADELELGGQVCVDAILPEKLVVLDMISL